jgi:hypothetical protein
VTPVFEREEQLVRHVEGVANALLGDEHIDEHSLAGAQVAGFRQPASLEMLADAYQQRVARGALPPDAPTNCRRRRPGSDRPARPNRAALRRLKVVIGSSFRK